MRQGISAAAALLVTAGAALAQPPGSIVPDLPPAAPVRAEGAPVLPFDSSCCPSGPHIWARADYLLWWLKDSPFPQPVATTGPFDADARANNIINGLPLGPAPGGVGTDGTRNLFGGHDTSFGALSGLRLSLGGTFGDSILGMEASGFVLERGSAGFSAASNASNGNPLLTRPFFDVANNRQATLIVASAGDTANIVGGLNGSIRDQLTTRLWGYEVNASALVLSTDRYRFTALAGFRYLDLQEKLSMLSQTQPTGQPLLGALGNNFDAQIGDNLTVFDQFGTRSQFYGGQVGGRFEYIADWLTVGATAKVGLGGTHQKVYVNGFSSLNGALVGVQTLPGGLYAQPSNSGTRTDNDLTWAPEVGVDLGVNLTSWARVTVGYTFLYWSRVVRASNQVNAIVDSAQIPTAGMYSPATATNNPAPVMNRTDFWAQGLSLGLVIRY